MAKRVVVYHRFLGCETGCCGHYAVMEDEAGIIEEGKFEFNHPYGGDHLEFAKEMITTTFGEEHVADLDWEHCIISDE